MVTGSGRGERGVVLATVLLLLLAVTLLVHGSFLLARSFQRGSAEGWEAIRARRAAVHRAGIAGVGSDTLPRSWSSTGGGVDVRLDPFPLSSEVTLFEASARAGAARWWAGRLVWRPEPLARGAAARFAARVGGRVVAGAGWGGVTPVPATPCGLPTPGPVGPLAPGGPGVGPLDVAGLVARLPPWPVGAPCPGGTCPTRAGAATGALRVDADLHPGVFVVQGDLVLAGTARVHGLLLIDGSLTVQDQAGVEGAVQVSGDLILSGGGTVVGDPCRVVGVWAAGVGDQVGPVPLGRRAWPLWSPPP